MSIHDAAEPTRPPPEPTGAEADPHPFPVVGVGASAGGLEALTELLESMSSDPGLTFLFALHLDPHQKSLLPEILSRVTSMNVRQGAEGMPIEVNHVYIIPPNTIMALTDGRLALTPRTGTPGSHMPIDHLFRSLALVHKNRAVAVVLSGGGTDGALGMHAIKAEGGITFAQDEKSARYDSMPRAAVLDGSVDYVLRPRDIATELQRIARHAYAREPISRAESPTTQSEGFSEIIGLLRARMSVDFTHYKQTTVQRRILRRMALRNIDDIPDYLKLLSTDPDELQNLYQDFLIRVTQFFRDPEAFESLKSKVFPTLLKGRQAGQPIRIWSAGCSTGEEAYSLAICLLEYLDGEPEASAIKILATDLNELALAKARAGVYLDNIEIDVSPERLRRFFIRHDGHYQISKSIREFCVFSRHNMATDPPFSRLDLACCRNVLI